MYKILDMNKYFFEGFYNKKKQVKRYYTGK